MPRRATFEDALAIATVHVRSWQAAYTGVFPSDWLDALEPEQRLPGWQRRLDAPDQRHSTVVAEHQGEIVGFADVGEARDEDVGMEVGEVFAIYLLPSVWRRGIGRELMAAAEEELRGLGFTSAVLWVLDSNDRAIGFYEAAGWHHDGVIKPDSFAGVDVAELRMVRALT